MPKRSDLTRKRKIRQNQSTHVTSWVKKPTCVTNPKTVTPAAQAKAFQEEQIVVSAGKLFCSACWEELSTKLSIIKNHISSSKHIQAKATVAKREARERDIAKQSRSMMRKFILLVKHCLKSRGFSV